VFPVRYELNLCYVEESRPPLRSSDKSSRLHIQRSRVRFPALPDFLRSSGSGTRSTQRLRIENEITAVGDPPR
jgi:hypothetical protein